MNAGSKTLNLILPSCGGGDRISKRVTIKDIANLAGVSITTVSNVINGRGNVSQETREAVQRIIREYNYAPSMAARSLRDKSAHLIALVVPFLPKGESADNPFFWKFIEGVEAGARSHQFHVIFTGLSNSSDLSFVRERHLDGLIVLGTSEGSDLVGKIKDMKIPCVFVDSYLNDEELYQVLLDDFMGGYLGTKHLIGHGHRRIILLSRIPEHNSVNRQRWLGYRKALEESGIPYDPELILEENATTSGGYYAAHKVYNKIKCENPATAVFSLSDVAAIGLMKGLREMGISVPGDISIVGFDDIHFSEFTWPALTTIRQDIFQKGRAAVGLLLDQILQENGFKEKKITLPVELKVRQSTGPAK